MSDFKDKLKTMSDIELMVYVPDVYQKSIRDIDYAKLKSAGVTCLCFDIDDTISSSLAAVAGTKGFIKHKISKRKVAFFSELKAMGFIIVLITNSPYDHAKRFGAALECHHYIGNAAKPAADSLQEVQEKYSLEKSQIAHVGKQNAKRHKSG
jgi:predicted HAD superfamily phosphohydrolase YqeG